MFIGASLSLKSLCCLRDGVRSEPSPLVPSSRAPAEKDGESEKGTGSGKGWRRTRTRRGRESEKERGREAFAGAHGERYIFPGRVAVAKSSQESPDKPTTVGAHPPHYAHRSRDFNVPRETAACRSVAPSRAEREMDLRLPRRC